MTKKKKKKAGGEPAEGPLEPAAFNEGEPVIHGLAEIRAMKAAE